MRIAVLVKQIPKFEEMELGPDGRLRRDGIEPEMNPYCRRAVSKAVELASRARRITHHGVHARAARGRRRAPRSDRVGPRTQRRDRWRAGDRPGVRRLRHARDRQSAGRRARTRGPVRTCARRAATRSTPTPARSDPRSPSCSTCRSSPAFATSPSKARVSTPGASTTTAGCRPRSSCPPCCRARNGCASRARSTPKVAPPCPPVASAGCRPPTSGRARGAPTRRPPGSGP